jgi:hypothetical protein
MTINTFGDKALKADGAKKQVISLKVKKCYRTRTSIRKIIFYLNVKATCTHVAFLNLVN